MPETVKVQLSQDPAIQEAIKEERVFHAIGLTAYPAADDREAYLTVLVPIKEGDNGSMKGTIALSEADMTFSPRNLNYLVGTDIIFVVKDVDDEKGVLICSRKIAQEKTKVLLLAEMAKGDTFEGRITGFTDFGAFVDVNGVYGMLRNTDYSTDHSRIESRYKIGDHINVKCKSVAQEGGRIYWEAATKYHRTTPVVCDVEEGAVTVAKVINVKTFDQGQGVFVRLADNSDLEVLCSMPRNIPELDRNVMVVVRIVSIRPGKDELDPPLLRGMILGLAQI